MFADIRFRFYRVPFKDVTHLHPSYCTVLHRPMGQTIMFATGYQSKVAWGTSPLGRKSTRNSGSYQSPLKKKMWLGPMVSLRHRVFNLRENFVTDCGITFVAIALTPEPEGVARLHKYSRHPTKLA